MRRGNICGHKHPHKKGACMLYTAFGCQDPGNCWSVDLPRAFALSCIKSTRCGPLCQIEEKAGGPIQEISRLLVDNSKPPPTSEFVIYFIGWLSFVYDTSPLLMRCWVLIWGRISTVPHQDITNLIPVDLVKKVECVRGYDDCCFVVHGVQRPINVRRAVLRMCEANALYLLADANCRSLLFWARRRNDTMPQTLKQSMWIRNAGANRHGQYRNENPNAIWYG